MTAAVSISSNVLPRYSMCLRGIDRQAFGQLGDGGAAVRLDEADDDVLAAFETAPRPRTAS